MFLAPASGAVAEVVRMRQSVAGEIVRPHSHHSPVSPPLTAILAIPDTDGQSHNRRGQARATDHSQAHGHMLGASPLPL